MTRQIEAHAWLRQAIELGLLDLDVPLPSEWPDIFDMLRTIATSNSRNARPSIKGIDVVLSRLEDLRAEESNAALELSEHRQRLNELRRMLESSESYGSAIRVQRDRLAISSWIKSIWTNENDAIAALGVDTSLHLNQLCDALSGTEAKLRTYPSLSDTLDSEVLRRRASTDLTISKLNETRNEISDLESKSEELQDLTDRFERTERFLGRLDQALKFFNNADHGVELRAEVSDLKARIDQLQRLVSEGEIRRRVNNALEQIQATSSRLIPKLDAEYPEAPFRLIINDLTIKVIRGKRDDYLWEIGSGANWLAYHVVTTAALQKYFLSGPHHPGHAVLVYDQPSQVYFPKSGAMDDDRGGQWKDVDVAAVRKIFALLGELVNETEGRLQVIVLDHASEDVWGGLKGVQLTEEWREGRHNTHLVPPEWIVG